jgi:hypothetical protein
MKTILVQMSDRRWTMPALHLACALARDTDADIILLRLMHVEHAAYLGTQFGYHTPTPQERDDIAEYKATAEDYGTLLTIQLMQCLSPLEGLVDAANQLDADAVFAYVPKSWIPYWQTLQKWILQHRLSTANRQIFMLDQPDPNKGRLPTITVRSVYTLSGQ